MLAVTTDREGRARGELLRWGLVPSWADEPDSRLKMINARVETVAERPAFRSAFERFRCLILADGFYEWSAPPDGGRKRAFHITRADGELFAFAGLWSIWRPQGDGDAPKLRSCTILTTAANSVVAPLHDRMPVILERDAEEAWLDPGDPSRAACSRCSPRWAPSRHRVTAVGPAVNDARYDGPECLAPADDPANCAGQPVLSMGLSPLLAGYDNVVLDLDGCVWVGDPRARGSAPEAIAELRAAGKRLAFRHQRRAALARGLRPQALVAGDPGFARGGRHRRRGDAVLPVGRRRRATRT